MSDSMNLLGYCHENGVYNFQIAIDTFSGVVQRKYHDFLRLNRTLRKDDTLKSSSPSITQNGMPLKQLKLLGSRGSWHLHGPGWKKDLTKSVSCIDHWFNIQLSNCQTRHLYTDFFDEVKFDLHQQLAKAQLIKSRRSKVYQQYFSSHLHHDILLRLALDGISYEASEDFSFVEPSCGDGRVLQALLMTGLKRVIGCELDAVVAHDAQKLVGDRCPIMVGNFLQAKLSTLQDMILLHNLSSNPCPDPQDDNFDNMQPHSSLSNDPTIGEPDMVCMQTIERRARDDIIVVGCPPYTYTNQCFGHDEPYYLHPPTSIDDDNGYAGCCDDDGMALLPAFNDALLDRGNPCSKTEWRRDSKVAAGATACDGGGKEAGAEHEGTNDSHPPQIKIIEARGNMALESVDSKDRKDETNDAIIAFLCHSAHELHARWAYLRTFHLACLLYHRLNPSPYTYCLNTLINFLPALSVLFPAYVSRSELNRTIS